MSTAIAPIDAFRKDLTAMQPEFAKALPPHVQSDRFTRVVMTAVQQNPDILKCDKRSLFGACMRAAQDGLLPDGREAALVQFGDKATYMPMVAGILKKARNSGEIATMAAEVVYTGDKFEYRIVNGKPEMLHEPQMFGARGDILGAYACAVLKDGSTMIEVLPKTEIDQIRQVSRSKDSGPWKAWYPEMAKKTALRRLAKRLPSSTDRDDDLIQTIKRDDELYDLNQTSETNGQAAASAAGAAPAKPKRSRGLDKVVQSGQTIDSTATEVKDDAGGSGAEQGHADTGSPI